MRKYNEKFGIKHKPTYFDEWQNPEDPEHVYYRYNGTYFEKDRPSKDWSRLPDLYSDNLPSEVEEYLKKEKKK